MYFCFSNCNMKEVLGKSWCSLVSNFPGSSFILDTSQFIKCSDYISNKQRANVLVNFNPQSIEVAPECQLSTVVDDTSDHEAFKNK